MGKKYKFLAFDLVRHRTQCLPHDGEKITL